ncbi:hypothetical protein [Fodinibius salsisoli]|uniref:Uncharacterized protein n=1 Tax=Fodinibius salsisoli TaxID=2820877 RepID=A0ABT3PMS7_9BACT|nr:hypothetical protein [Fodinibius salsisoli]MCW9707254.1 hypothetical protein [Fodinibius salsisoli]
MNRISYSDIDPILNEWASRHGLHISTRYKDYEVRAVTIVDDSGDMYGLGVWPIENSGKVEVSVNLKERSQRRTSIPEKKKLQASKEVSVSDLPKTLEEFYNLVEDWISEEGHTRTTP